MTVDELIEELEILPSTMRIVCDIPGEGLRDYEDATGECIIIEENERVFSIYGVGS